MSDIRQGDRVRVVIEGEVTDRYEGHLIIAGIEEFDYPDLEDHVVSIERIAPVLKEGDVVVSANGGRYTIVGESSYFSYQTHEQYSNVNLESEFKDVALRVVGNVFEMGEDS